MSQVAKLIRIIYIHI